MIETKTNLMNSGVPTIDINNIQDILVNAIVNLSISIFLFSVSFFILILISKRFFVFKNKIFYKKILAYVCLGIAFSFVSVALYAIADVVELEYIILNQIIFFFLYGLFTSSFTMVGITFGFIGINVYYLFHNAMDTIAIDMSYLTIFYVLIGVLVFVSRFIYENKFFYIFFSFVFLFLFMALIAYLIYDYDKFFSIFIIELIDFVIFVVLYLIANYINTLIENTYKLKTSIKYDNNIFVNSGYSEIAFKEYIKKNNINFGLFLTFDFKNAELILKDKGNFTLQEIKKQFIKQIYFHYGENCFYFKTGNNDYGIFLEVDKRQITLKKSIINNKLILRTDDDFLKEHETFLKKIPKKINFENKNYDIQLVCYGSLYGIHANEYNKLISFNQKLKSEIYNNKENIIKLYAYKENKNELKQLQKIKKKHNLNKVIFNTEILDVKLNNKKICKNDLIWAEKNIFSYQDLYLYNFNETELNILIRHFAYKFLSLFKQINQTSNNLLYFLDYSLDYVLSNEFNVENFINKIKLFNLSPNKIILNFNLKNVDITYFERVMIDNLISLANKKIKISFSNFDHLNKEKFEHIFNKIDIFLWNYQ